MHGCDEVQGYHYSAPLGAAEVPSLLRAAFEEAQIARRSLERLK